MAKDPLDLYKSHLDRRIETMENIAEESVNDAIKLLENDKPSVYYIKSALEQLDTALRVLAKAQAFREARGEFRRFKRKSEEFESYE